MTNPKKGKPARDHRREITRHEWRVIKHLGFKQGMDIATDKLTAEVCLYPPSKLRRSKNHFPVKAKEPIRTESARQAVSLLKEFWATEVINPAKVEAFDGIQAIIRSHRYSEQETIWKIRDLIKSVNRLIEK